MVINIARIRKARYAFSDFHLNGRIDIKEKNEMTVHREEDKFHTNDHTLRGALELRYSVI